MAHYDDILAAFRRIEPRIVTCHRGGEPGHTPVHGPSQAAGPERRNTHWVVVERQNGTVALRRPLALELGAIARQLLPISQHPLGYSHRAAFGEFDHGFEATVILYFAPQTPVREVLRAVAPSPMCGRPWPHLVRCLKRFGIVAEWRERLGLGALRRLTAGGKPVIVTVEPEDYSCDHWTVIRGVDLRRRRVHLTNYEYADAGGSMAWAAFRADWSPPGCGWVCEQ